MVTVVPLIIFLPYVEAFNVEYKSLNNPNFMYDPISVVSMVLENRVVFAANLFDFTTKLIPQLSILLSLITMSELLGRADVKVIPGDGRPSMQSMEVKSRASFIKAAGLQPSAESSQTPSQSKSLHTLQRWKHGATVTVFVLWGFIVLLLHSLAAQRAANYEVLGCRAVTRPWISSGKEPCASLVYDCHAHNTTTPDQTSFDKLDPVVLASLTIAHCHGLEMPPDLQRLENLVSLHICNTTIVNWNVTSSISATVHRRLQVVLVAGARMDQMPEGILQPLPGSVMGLQFSHTNLKTLPDDLYQRWHPLAAIAFEHSELTKIPYQMFFSLVYTLSLLEYQIETIPTLAMMPPGIVLPNLQLAANPLKELPATLMEPTAFIVSMNVQNTSLTSMPAWVKTNTKVVWASGTPFCATPMVDPTLTYQVMCSQLAGQDLSFPIDLLGALYPYET
ncbi:hypothetical protein PHYSODRAFT_474391 [Phytophthora sojae]|uniref:Leucine-rich repeat-containing N-terminal plant-type domain-containing protein n=1 Tax=Phytophthora sojae (strain P6497) TaxID=1094619 RepID=G4YFR4_PHYSP|nr:hypothetical protein PHYSODRAFT_474391 [Phytophthora sojae]EGZ27641.1 hypothetical protein PHYSODRAFT_474391 [Phytophthora sojae]|eukprot:XP_009514916.1 hypothetical protein PHYSODRAFT_474391 [Phytophthora sojae]